MNSENIANNTETNSVKSVKLRINKKTALIGGAVIAVAVIIAVIALVAGGNNYEKVGEKYINSILQGDLKKTLEYTVFEKVDFEEYLELTADYYNEDLDDVYDELGNELGYDGDIENADDLFDAAHEATVEELKDSYGKNYKIKAKMLEKEKMDEYDIEDIQEEIENWMEQNDWSEAPVDTDKITKGYRATFEVTIEGEERTEEVSVILYIVKYNGSWKVADEDVFDIYF